MIKRPNTNAQRLKRHKRVRGKIAGTPEMPRLNVFRSEANIYAQVIDDVNGVTPASASSLDKAMASWLLSAPRPRVSRTWFSTAAVTCTTAVFRHWPKAPAKAA